MPRAERKRSRHELAGTEAEAFPGRPRTSAHMMAQPARVSADRAAWREGRSRASHLRIMSYYVERSDPEGYIIHHYRMVAFRDGFSRG